jgi:IclR family pca regulon transcriptional regulator
MGRVLLAGLPPEVMRQRLVGLTMESHTEHSITDPQRLIEAIEQVRIQGWCLVSEELERGLVSLAAPIVDRNGKIVAAINISGQVNNPSPANLLENCLPKLLAAAAKINLLVR